MYEGWNSSFPLSLSSLNCLDVKKDIAALRSIIKIKCKQAEQHWSQQQIKLFADLRCDNYTNNLASFIDSSLERTKRTIVLDRVLVNSNSNMPILLTEGKDIKKAVNEHFQNFVPISSIVTSLDNMPDRWKSCYDPLTSVNSQIYDTLMSLPLKEEWTDLLHHMPKGKAPGLSKISNEMLHNLGPNASDFLYELICTCLETGKIPTKWRSAVIYPILKPQEWNCELKNTRPITLLETVRKALVKLITNRLSNMLYENHVLQGGNYAGLPGGSCQEPIRILESYYITLNKRRRSFGYCLKTSPKRSIRSIWTC